MFIHNSKTPFNPVTVAQYSALRGTEWLLGPSPKLQVRNSLTNSTLREVFQHTETIIDSGSL